ncbi:MAG: PilZ domain-containing protein [Myxococcales bacterium]|nr:PilZ domain-containing protein [Myxococcales bacterium]
MPEKRSAVRVPVSFPACYRSAAATIEGTVTDLSRLGMFLAAEFLDSPGAAGVVEVTLPGAFQPLFLRGEIVRVETGAGGHPGGMAIRFASLPDEVRRPLANFMMEASYRALT